LFADFLSTPYRNTVMKTTLKTITFCLTFLSVVACAGTLRASDEGAPKVAPVAALDMLKEGNARFVAGTLQQPNAETARALETATHGQHPFVTVLSCSDSRVPLEVVFDQGIGDIFTIRVAGNVSAAHQIRSIEYGVAHTSTRLVVVLGHTICGAITAACTDGGHEGNVESLMQTLKPVVRRTEAATGKKGQEIVEACCHENVLYQIEALYRNSSILREAAHSGEIQIVGAIYNIETGKVEWLGPHPKAEVLGHSGGASVDLGKGDASGQSTGTGTPARQKLFIWPRDIRNGNRQ
jgi:carbonic anhydrase